MTFYPCIPAELLNELALPSSVPSYQYTAIHLKEPNGEIEGRGVLQPKTFSKIFREKSAVCTQK